MRFPIDNFLPKPYPRGDVVQYYGEHPEMYKIQKNHCGWDIIPNDRTPYGTPIYSRYDGTVIEIGADSNTSYGKAIRTVRGDGLMVIYGHNSKVLVSLGQEVTEGQQIAEMGNTGYVVSSTPWVSNPQAGTHLHVTFIPAAFVQPNDPPAFSFSFPTGHTLRPLYYNNGNQGAVNPAPYFADLERCKLFFPRNLQRGDTGLDVEELQTVLWMEGLLERVDIIGTYGPKTQAAVFAYQRRYNIVSMFDMYRGRYCGPKTLAVIKEMYAPWV